ncbi:MAG: hypothetical protein ABIF82_01625, partial [Planctomycetota bacterium]
RLILTRKGFRMAKKQDQPEPATSTIDQLKAARLKRRREAAEQYRELLLRNDKPKPGDTESLAAVMQVLGREPADLPNDIALVRALAASEDAERQARKLDGPCAKAKDALRETKARIEQERADFERHVREELEAADIAFRKLDAERRSLVVVSQQAPRDEWTALVEGVSAEEARAARRAARHPTVATEPLTREEVIAKCRERMAVHRLAPASGTAIEHVNAELRLLGLPPLTEDEIQKHDGIEGWLLRRRQ